jgi:23S rRNA (adenine2503-C2)-methyltransferase
VDPVGSLYNLTRSQLEQLMAALGVPRYRADQVWGWLYRQGVDTIADMTSLPVALRERLAAVATLQTITPVRATESDDGFARKVLFRLADGQLVEAVLMHYLDPADAEAGSVGGPPRGRHTVCLSTQAGCAMGCVFCATGQMGLLRDLTLGECVEQLVYFARQLRAAGEQLTHVVFMGMGEPLANWPATWGTVEALTDPDGFGLGARRLTISTVGLVPGIQRLAAAGKPVRLAVSVHAADPGLRTQLVPINATYPLADVLAACRTYQARTGRRITFEVVLIAGVNDSPAQARLLARRLAGLKAHVNLIPLNPTAGFHRQPSAPGDAAAFRGVLAAQGIPATLRLRRGIQIQAGCGQLRSRAGEGRLGRTVGARPGLPAAPMLGRGPQDGQIAGDGEGLAARAQEAAVRPHPLRG